MVASFAGFSALHAIHHNLAHALVAFHVPSLDEALALSEV